MKALELVPPPSPLEILRRDRSPVTVDAIVFGEWAAHACLDGDGWVVTHVASTMRIPSHVFSVGDVVEYNEDGDETIVYDELDRDEAIAVARALSIAGHIAIRDEDKRCADTENRWLCESLIAEALAEVWS